MSRLLKIGYTTTARAVAKGILDLTRVESVAACHNYGDFFDDVLCFIPFGKADIATRLSPTVQYEEVTFAPNGNKMLAALVHLNRMRCRLRDLLHHFRPDVVQICGPHLPAMLALSSSHLRKLPTVCFLEAFWETILHDQSYFPPMVRRLLPAWYRIVYHAFDVYTGAPSLSPTYYTCRGMTRARIARWVQDIDLRLIDDVSPSEAPVDLSSLPRPLACVVGRLHPEKLPDDALEIFRRVAETGRPGSLVMVGDGSERQHLTQWVKEQGIADHVAFLGQLPLCQTIAVMKACDLMIAPMQGTALVEGMATGLAIVAYDHETHRAHIRDGVNGHLVPHRDVLAAAKALQRLIDNPSECKRLGRAAFNYVHERYSFENVYEIMADGFKKAMLRRQPIVRSERTRPTAA